MIKYLLTTFIFSFLFNLYLYLFGLVLPRSQQNVQGRVRNIRICNSALPPVKLYLMRIGEDLWSRLRYICRFLTAVQAIMGTQCVWQYHKAQITQQHKLPHWKFQATCMVHVINALSAGLVYIRHWSLIINVSANVLAPNGARPSADTVMITKWDMFSFNFSLTVKHFRHGDIF